MTEHNLNAGDLVLVQVGVNIIKAEVVQPDPVAPLVRSVCSGSEFFANKVLELLTPNATKTENTARRSPETHAQPEETASENPDAHSEIAENREESANPTPEIPAGDREIPAEIAAGDREIPAEIAAGDREIPAEIAAGDREIPADQEEETAPRLRGLSLIAAGYEVLKAEKRPMNCREIVERAVDLGLWVPTAGKTPAQSLYGSIFLEIRNAKEPRFKRSAVRGCFEAV